MTISAVVVLGTLIVGLTIGVIAHACPTSPCVPLLLILGVGADRAADRRVPDELHGVAGRRPGDAPAGAPATTCRRPAAER